MAEPTSPPVSRNFIRQAIEADLAGAKYAARQWAGAPGPGPNYSGGGTAVHGFAPDPARIRTRFPPEPNGYLHFGHAKSICLNFGLAAEYGGVCHQRFNDTNPEKEEQKYVDSIIDAVHWLGFEWGAHCYFASDYFQWMYEFAEVLIAGGPAYVDSQSADGMDGLEGNKEELFIIFGDSTNENETYPSGRYLYVKKPDENGKTIIDFNKSYNPPCAFTPFATCPLPPSQNVLPIAIRSGEKNYKGVH